MANVRKKHVDKPAVNNSPEQVDEPIVEQDVPTIDISAPDAINPDDAVKVTPVVEVAEPVTEAPQEAEPAAADPAPVAAEPAPVAEAAEAEAPATAKPAEAAAVDAAGEETEVSIEDEDTKPQSSAAESKSAKSAEATKKEAAPAKAGAGSKIISGIKKNHENAKKANEERVKRQEARDEEIEVLVAANQASYDKAVAMSELEDEDFLGDENNAPSVEIEVETVEKDETSKTGRKKTKSTERFSASKNNFEGGQGAIDEMIERQRDYYDSHITQRFEWRDTALARLHSLIHKYEKPLVEALHRDLGITRYEAYMTELAPVYETFAVTRKNLRKWTGRTRLGTASWRVFPETYETYLQPYGVVCIINTWNSPVLMSLLPLCYALAAGNTVVIKNSNRTRRVNQVLNAAVLELFKPDYVRFIYGEDNLDKALVNSNFDKVFFTGNRDMEHEVLRGAAEALAPTTMLLSGNNPVVVDSTANIDSAAEKVMWGKMIHSGQTRITPSYAFVSEKVHKTFINRTYTYIQSVYGKEPIKSKDYPRMFSKTEYDQACKTIDDLAKRGKIIYGGERDPKKLRIAPTVILVNSVNNQALKKPIIGPVLPVVTFKHPEEAFEAINKMPTPPALYLFTKSKSAIKYAMNYVAFGSGCINDTMMQISNVKKSYGAMGEGGMGGIGGRYGVEAFGVQKLIARGRKKIPAFRRAPFPESIKKIQRRFKYRDTQ